MVDVRGPSKWASANFAMKSWAFFSPLLGGGPLADGKVFDEETLVDEEHERAPILGARSPFTDVSGRFASSFEISVSSPPGEVREYSTSGNPRSFGRSASM